MHTDGVMEFRSAPGPVRAALLDGSVLRQLAADIEDEEAVRELVGVYLEKLPARRTAVQLAADQGDDLALRAAMHALGSASLLLGAMALGELCRAWENEPEPPPGGIARWQRTAEATATSLNGWLSSPS